MGTVCAGSCRESPAGRLGLPRQDCRSATSGDIPKHWPGSRSCTVVWVERRGVVHISPHVAVPSGLSLAPEESLFGASWQDDERELDRLDYVCANTAVAWGRDRARIVLIRLGHRVDDYFTAGDLRPEDDSPKEPHLPDWPPARAPDAGWWHLPPFPSLVEVEQTAARVRAG